MKDAFLQIMPYFRYKIVILQGFKTYSFKIMIRRIILTMAFLASLSLSAKDVNMGSWQIVPLPQQVKEMSSAPFRITAKTTIYYAAGDEKQKKDAEFLASHIKEVTGIGVKTTDKQAKGQIRLALNAGDTQSEAYSLVVNKNGITISAISHAGIFYGIQSVMKALPITKNVKSVSLPAAEVTDAPRFAYRAFMIDVGRHYFSVPYLKKLIDVFAMHNINYFHWHLTEDQGWRLEIKKYPMLTQIGSKRKETILPTNKNEFDGVPVSGYYTQEEAREIVKYAADRYITVIPEVDMPGHMLAALASYPELGCTGGPYEVATRFGVFEDVLCAGKAQTLQFAKDVMDEIMDIFPSEYIHIGGDECPKNRWKVCGNCQKKIAELGIQELPKHSKEEQLQTWFMGEIEKQIRNRGRKMMGWDEILEGTPSKDITVCGWTSVNASIRSAREGHPTIVAPISNFYFSNPRINKIEGIPSIQRVYDLDPCSDKLTPAEQQNIIGAEGCIWTEWVKDAEKMEWELLPRLAALSEVQWTAKDKRNLENFFLRMLHMQDLYRLYGLNYKADIEDAVKKHLEEKK